MTRRSAHASDRQRAARNREKRSDESFRKAAAAEIEQFRRERVERSGLQERVEDIDDVSILREVMNTVGKEGRLGGDIRCVVSVSMLTEGWDANTVTHVLGIRAFGTQLLCEQVIGRALRRQSYDLNEEGLFNVEYADVLGIPFDFAAKPVVVVAVPPRQTIQVKAVRPERDALEISFPRVMGYRVELPNERLTAKFTDDSKLFLTPELTGPSQTQNAGIVGESVNLTVSHLQDTRPSTVLYQLTTYLLCTKRRGSRRRGAAASLRPASSASSRSGWTPTSSVEETPIQRRFSTATWPTWPANALLPPTNTELGPNLPTGISIKVLLDPFNPVGSTRPRQLHHIPNQPIGMHRPRRCHINWIILDSDWEAEFCRVAENHPRVRSYVKNHNLGFDVPYRYGSESRIYRPDFIVLVEDGHGEDDLLHLVVEVKGYRREDAKDKKLTMENYWVPGVNSTGKFGRWAFVEFTEVFGMNADFTSRIDQEFEKMVESVTAPQPEPQQK